ncbi:pyridoxine/pyridoxamine 5'-phosphate oxidase-like [Frankliniella occidentalis]|uniref:pyridoxal 5'-phosphate synthase n=1 Tax=Frankliniella occidentalis TaxID=133901 RepID=A0A6J1TPK9_FRAOC|nr:pyridoxine/pyridoxamine 5'-phosphate oxidase-like [Frankliniella occidentalis]
MEALSERLSELRVQEGAEADPDGIFQRWRRDARAAQLVMPDSAVLTTSTRSGRASARTVCFRRMDEGRFVFLTDSRSKKCRELAENPRAGIAFLWAFVDGAGQRVAREVRVAGSVTALQPPAYEDLYWSLIPNRRIRAYICEQGAAADWDRLQERHDQLLLEVDKGKRLPMPGHFVAYELFPTNMEFYEQIEDEEDCQGRHFSRQAGQWRAQGLAA